MNLHELPDGSFVNFDSITYIGPVSKIVRVQDEEEQIGFKLVVSGCEIEFNKLGALKLEEVQKAREDLIYRITSIRPKRI
jgi:hypothetical protein